MSLTCQGCLLQWKDEHWKENFNLDKGDIDIKWFQGGKTNIAYNCLDRHVKEGRGDQPCFLWEGNDTDQSCVMTYKQVLQEVSRLVSLLSKLVCLACMDMMHDSQICIACMLVMRELQRTNADKQVLQVVSLLVSLLSKLSG